MLRFVYYLIPTYSMDLKVGDRAIQHAVLSFQFLPDIQIRRILNEGGLFRRLPVLRQRRPTSRGRASVSLLLCKLRTPE